MTTNKLTTPSAPYRGQKVRYNPLGYSCDALQIYGVKSRSTLERAIDERLDSSTIITHGSDRPDLTHVKGQPCELCEVLVLSERQFIGVYVDNDQDARILMAALRALKAGDSIMPNVKIQSLDWDSFEPSSPQDEQWRAGSQNSKDGQS